MANRYEITTFDVCAAGMERLRNRDEFILVAGIHDDTDSADLLQQWKDDVQCCDRGDNFDFDAIDATLDAFYLESVKPLFGRKSNPFSLEHLANEDDECCVAILFIRDNEHVDA